MNKYDSQLHILRSVARSVAIHDQRASQQMESARFNLFAAIEGEDWELALKWLTALEVSIRAELTAEDPANLLAVAQATIADLRTALEQEAQ